MNKLKNSMDYRSLLIRSGVKLAGLITMGSLTVLIAYVFIMGVANIKMDMFSIKYTTENASMLPAIINTLQLIFISLVISSIIGIFAAIYMVEYAKGTSKVTNVIRLTVETLAGIPSIVYGLFGYLAFVVGLKLGYSILAGAFTMSIMILPLIIRTTEEALLAIDDIYREGSYGLGAGKLRTIFSIVLPSATPGILSGIIIAMGRVIGETAALIYTAGSVPDIAKSVFNSGRTLSVHMFSLLSEGIYTRQAYATAVVLLIFIIVLNSFARFLFKKLNP